MAKESIVLILAVTLVLAGIIGYFSIHSAPVEQMTASNCKTQVFKEAYSIDSNVGEHEFQIDKVPYSAIEADNDWSLLINKSNCRVEESGGDSSKAFLAKATEDAFTPEMYDIYGNAIPSYVLWGGVQTTCGIGDTISNWVNSKPADFAVDHQKFTAQTINDFTNLSVGWQSKKLANGTINLIKSIRGSEEISITLQVHCALAQSELVDVYNQMNIGKVILEKEKQKSHYTGENKEIKIISSNIEEVLAKGGLDAQANNLIAGTLNPGWKTETIRANNQKLATTITQAEQKAAIENSQFTGVIAKAKNQAQEKIGQTENAKKQIPQGIVDTLLPLRLYKYQRIQNEKNYDELFAQTLYPPAEKEAEKTMQEIEAYKKITNWELASGIILLSIIVFVLWTVLKIREKMKPKKERENPFRF